MRLQHRKPIMSWAAPKAVWVAAQGRWFCLSALLDETPQEYCIQLWSPAQERLGPLAAGPKESHDDNQKAGISLLWTKADRVVVVQPGEEKALGDLIAAF
ncbi:hypothetical protein WISP_145135 [Willisornis vidua]|uniref:Uncharacterized protein n=1 Tax=Willisornis vidua TaxID=1566151 RepID=A0ABQ9CM23_9PASS|nr:hypothetical protein WISP_145135 [Willisornis vidua]